MNIQVFIKKYERTIIKKTAVIIFTTVLFLVFFLQALYSANLNNGTMTPEEWRKFGKALIENAPDVIKNSSDLIKSKYVTASVGVLLAKLGVKPNIDLSGRITQGEEGKCDDISIKLGSTLEGAGIENVYLRADKYSFKTPNSVLFDYDKTITDDEQEVINEETRMVLPPNPLDVNVNHGAVAVCVDGEIYIFDLWAHGRGNNGSFLGIGDSPWNGMTLSEWEKKMKAEGYVLFTGDSVHKYKSTVEAMKYFVKNWKEQYLQKKKKEAISSNLEKPEERTERILKEYRTIYLVWLNATNPGVKIVMVANAVPVLGKPGFYRVAGRKEGKNTAGYYQVLSSWDLIFSLEELEYYTKGHKKELEKMKISIPEIK